MPVAKKIYYLHGDTMIHKGEHGFFCARCDGFVNSDDHFHDDKAHKGGMKAHIERFKFMQKNWKKSAKRSDFFRPDNVGNVFQ